MVTISNLNSVVQQGNSAQELQQSRQQSPENNQMLASQNQANKEIEQRSTVQHADEMEKNNLKEDGPRKGRYLLRKKKKKKKKSENNGPAASGRLLDTIA